MIRLVKGCWQIYCVYITTPPDLSYLYCEQPCKLRRTRGKSEQTLELMTSEQLIGVLCQNSCSVVKKVSSEVNWSSFDWWKHSNVGWTCQALPPQTLNKNCNLWLIINLRLIYTKLDRFTTGLQVLEGCISVLPGRNASRWKHCLPGVYLLQMGCRPHQQDVGHPWNTKCFERLKRILKIQTRPKRLKWRHFRTVATNKAQVPFEGGAAAPPFGGRWYWSLHHLSLVLCTSNI